MGATRRRVPKRPCDQARGATAPRPPVTLEYMSDDDWTGYAPVGGPPPNTHCFFCGTEYRDLPERRWAISNEGAICGQCIKRLAVTFARQDKKTLDDWAANWAQSGSDLRVPPEQPEH
jgi:hypothetical protein